MALNGEKREKYQEKVFDGAVETHVVALRCSTPPAGYSGLAVHRN